MEDKRGFYFKTPKGNAYYYDDITGEVGSVEKSQYPDENICYGKAVYRTNIITAEQIKVELEKHGYNQLILIVTHECNIRCKYCAYSGEYDNNRQHANVNMNFETAKKAILMYFGYVRKIKTRKPLFVPDVSFYGGEPLINFKLIKQIVNFIKEIYEGEVHYNITTNACMLDDSKVKFFAENKVLLSISLNGYAEEHDRLRVYANGKGTYSYAMGAIRRLSEMAPEYYRKYCHIVGVYDTGTNLEKVEEYFEKEELLKDKLLLYVPVMDYGTNWYNQYNQFDRERFQMQLEKLKQKYIENIKNGKKESQLQRNIFSRRNILIVNRPLNCSLKDVTGGLLPNVGACIPGHKLAIDPYGVIHACEKINDKMPFGTVDKGVDYEKIAEILNKYNATLAPLCINCPISRFCPHCYQTLIDEQGDFDLSRVKTCRFHIKAKISQMIQIYDMLEENVSIDTLTGNRGEENG